MAEARRAVGGLLELPPGYYVTWGGHFEHLEADGPRDRGRAAAKTSRQLRLLRAHGVIRKVPKTHRYRLTTNASS